MIKVTLEFPSYEDAAAVLLALATDQRAGKPVSRPPAAPEAAAATTGKPAKTAKPADTSPPATQAAAPAAASAGKATTPPPPPSPSPSPAASTGLADKKYPETGIAELINKFASASKDNRTVAVAALGKMGGATKGTELKPEFYDAAHAAFTALCAGTDPAAVLAGLDGGEEDTGLG
jgi:hypothetical protein